jgi:hypothetical protein
MKRVNGAPAGVRDTEKMTFVKLSETVGGSGEKKSFSSVASGGLKRLYWI